jgi:hypothetical protein
MAKKNKENETEAPPAAQTLRTADPPASPAPAQTTATVEAQDMTPSENTGSEETSPLAHAIDKLADYLVSRGLERPPDWQVADVVIETLDGFYARLAELDPPRAAPSAPPADDKGRAADAYALFRERQVEGDFPAWAELPEQTQKLWRDSYQHVAAGGAPRTDYEEVVKYLINSAQ